MTEEKTPQTASATLSNYEADIVTKVLQRVIENLFLEDDGKYHEYHLDWMLSMDKDVYEGLVSATAKLRSTLPPITQA